MSTESLAMIVRGEITEEVVERLYERADDFSISVAHDGRSARIEVDRQSQDVFDAIMSAIDDVEEAAPDLEIDRVEPDELVYATEIAERVGRSRQSVDHLIRGVRGPGDFPAPISHAGGRNPLWRWSEIETWFAAYEGRSIDQHETERQNAISFLNGMLELRRFLSTLPSPAAEHAKLLIKTKLLEADLEGPA